ncbi:hypothetical protein Tco_0699371, partial [Tanacetum coccineum]
MFLVIPNHLRNGQYKRDPSSFLAFLELLPDFPGLRWLWRGVVNMRIRNLRLENSESEMKNVGSKSRAANSPAERCILTVAWPHSDTITASTCMFVRLMMQTDASIMMLLDKLGPTPSHVAATKSHIPVGKGQPHIVHGKLEQGGSAAPLLARDTKTEPEGFAYVKEVVKI